MADGNGRDSHDGNILAPEAVAELRNRSGKERSGYEDALRRRYDEEVRRIVELCFKAIDFNEAKYEKEIEGLERENEALQERIGELERILDGNEELSHADAFADAVGIEQAVERYEVREGQPADAETMYFLLTKQPRLAAEEIGTNGIGPHEDAVKRALMEHGKDGLAEVTRAVRSLEGTEGQAIRSHYLKIINQD